MTITCEDNMELMARYPDGYFDLAVVDPPYFSGPEKRKFYGKSISSHGVKRTEYILPENSWKVPNKEYYRELCRVSNHQIIWGINYFEFQAGPGRIVWDKINEHTTYSDCELASNSLINSVRVFRFMWSGMMQGIRIDGTVMEGRKHLNEKRIHPTQKPVKLYEWIFKNYANPGDKILAPHLGSGSIVIALDRMNKIEGMNLSLVACELDPDYYKAAMKRIESQTRQTAIAL